MIPSNPSPHMNSEDLAKFRNGINRRLSGNFTTHEKELFVRAKMTYDEIIRTNGGKNPILGF